MWTLLYDGDCGFCTWVAGAILRWDWRERIVARSIQSDAGQALLADLAPEQRLESVHLIAPDGTRHSAGAALPPLLALVPGGAVPGHALGRVPWLSERGYRWVAAHRSQLGRLTARGGRGRGPRPRGGCGCHEPQR